MKLTLTTFLTLDGVMQAPGGPEEDRSGGFDQGGWLVPYADQDMGDIVVNWFAQADAFLLGRRTFEIFASHWPHVGDDDPIAAGLNKLPKYVVSRTLTAPDWQPTEVISGDVAKEVAALKARPGNDLQVHGSGQLAQTLMAERLIDEYRLFVYPVMLGTGQRLFNGPEAASAFRLTDAKTTSAGVQVLTYVPDGEPRHGSFALQ